MEIWIFPAHRVHNVFMRSRSSRKVISEVCCLHPPPIGESFSISSIWVGEGRDIDKVKMEIGNVFWERGEEKFQIQEIDAWDSFWNVHKCILSWCSDLKLNRNVAEVQVLEYYDIWGCSHIFQLTIADEGRRGVSQILMIADESAAQHVAYRSLK